MTSDQAEQKTVWDWWPLARLLITTSVFGFAAHHFLGWTPGFRELASLPRRVFEVLSFCALISFGLAHLYLILLMFPLYAVVTLNDTFYDLTVAGGRWVGLKSGRGLSLVGLCGELVLFAAAGILLYRAVLRI